MSTVADMAIKTEDGRVVAIAGPVVDVEFPPEFIPEINMAVEMDLEMDGDTVTIIAEVAQQIGEGRVRCVCLKPTDGLRRGTVVRNTGKGISVPVGSGVLGHVFNVTGKPLDIDTIDAGIEDTWQIHRDVAATRAQHHHCGVALDQGALRSDQREGKRVSHCLAFLK